MEKRIILICVFLAAVFICPTPSIAVEYRKISVTKKAEFDLYVKKYVKPIHISWGRIVENEQKGTRWEESVKAMYFFAFSPRMPFEKWSSAYSKDTFKDAQSAEEGYEETLKTYPDASDFRKTEAAKRTKSEWVHGEVWIRDLQNREFCFLVKSNDIKLDASQGSAVALVLEDSELVLAAGTGSESVTSIEGFGHVPIALLDRIFEIYKSGRATVSEDSFLVDESNK